MLTELIDKIDNNPELMLNLAEQLGKLTDYLGEDKNSVYLLKPLEYILSSDDTIVRDKAIASLKLVGQKISNETIYTDYMPLVKKMRKGDLFSMRISACFLYAYIYKRLDDERKAYTRSKFEKLSKDDTPMVRRGAAQSLAILSDSLYQNSGSEDTHELAKTFLLPILKALLSDDNDSVKIQAVGASVKVAKLVDDVEVVKSELIPPLRTAVDNKMVSWRLRFSVAEVAAELAGHVDREIADTSIVGYYVTLLQDKEPEVRSEAVAKLPELGKNCSPSAIVEQILPILNANTVNDNSLHVKGSLALALCEMSQYIGKENVLQFVIPPITQMLKDSPTEVKITLMQHMKTLAEIIGDQEFDTHIIPGIIQLSNDKIWRVKLAVIQFIPSLAEFIPKQLFKERLEEHVISWLSDAVFQVREEAIQILIQLKEKIFDQDWLEETIERKCQDFHQHEKFGIRIHTIFLIQKVAEHVSPNFLNEKLVPFLLKLGTDPVPNIKFNVAKAVEQLYPKFSNSNKMQAQEMLENMIEKEERDFDVKYYGEKALKTIKSL
eukprot:403339428